MLFTTLNRIRIHFGNLVFKFLSFLGFVKIGYDSEPNYKFLRNSKIDNLINEFKFWVDDDERQEFYNNSKNLINTEIKKTENLVKNNFSKELRGLKEDGCVKFNNLILSDYEIKNIRKKLDNKYLYLGRVVPFSKYKTKSFFLAKSLTKQASYSLEDILKCEELLKVITNKNIIGLATDYFDCTPTIGEINLYWTFPKIEDRYVNFNVTRFHRDVEDYRNLKFFINLTDTSENDGGLKYIKGSNKVNFLKNNLDKKKIHYNADDVVNLNRVPNGLYNMSEIIEKNFKECEEEFYSKKGGLFAVDHYGLHKAVQSKKPRLVMWITFHLSQSTGRHHYLKQNLKIQRRIPYSMVSNYIDNTLTNSFIYKSIINFEI